MDIKKNASLIAAIAVPVLMMIAISASIYLPAMFVRPGYDFIYTDNQNYDSSYRYSVDGGMIKKEDVPCDSSANSNYCNSRTGDGKIYYYDVARNESRELPFEEANRIKLDSSYKSPDGFEIMGSSGGGPFFSGDYNAKFIKKGAYSKKINKSSANGYNFEFLGWVIK